MVARRHRAVVLSFCLAGCGDGGDASHPPPPISGATSSTGPTDITVGSGMIDPMPDPCAPAGGDSGEDDGEAGGDDGFKFDVGGPDGSVGFSLSCDDVADAPSNLGCTFWAVDLPNDERGTDMSPPAAEQPFAVVVANVSALGDAHVEVFSGNGDAAIETATLAPLATHVFDLGQANIAASTSSTDGIAFRVQSDVPVAAYQFNPAANTVEVYSNDASLLLPENALGADYTAATADGILLGMGPGDSMPVNAGAFVSVVATVDGTDVEFSPTASIVGGVAEHVTLDRGQVATIVSDALTTGGGNLSGTRVHASDPVAVFAGNVATAIPANSSVCCADHLEHQLLPATA
jgi:IgGFc binding protein